MGLLPALKFPTSYTQKTHTLFYCNLIKIYIILCSRRGKIPHIWLDENNSNKVNCLVFFPIRIFHIKLTLLEELYGSHTNTQPINSSHRHFGNRTWTHQSYTPQRNCHPFDATKVSTAMTKAFLAVEARTLQALRVLTTQSMNLLKNH